jgi:hypothetical protein
MIMFYGSLIWDIQCNHIDTCLINMVLDKLAIKYCMDYYVSSVYLYNI